MNSYDGVRLVGWRNNHPAVIDKCLLASLQTLLLFFDALYLKQYPPYAPQAVAVLLLPRLAPGF